MSTYLQPSMETTYPTDATTTLHPLLNPLALRTHAGQVVRSFVAGAVIGPVTIVVVISFAGLIYAGLPAEYLARGIGLTLFGNIIFNLVIALAGSAPGMVVASQDSPAAILALANAGIVHTMAASAPMEQIFATIVAAVVLSSLLTALLFLLVGTFRLGNLVRYLPYPVIGGFLAGTGVLLIQGAMRSMTGVAISPTTLLSLLNSALVTQWLPGLLLAICLTIALRRYSHVLLLPGILLTATTLFYLCLWGNGIALGDARQQGWLLAGVPADALWQPPSPSLLYQISWRALNAQLGTLLAIPILSTITMLLNGRGFELIRRSNIDFNRELRVMGLSNLLCGLSGSHPGYMVLSLSTLVHKIGVGTRMTNLFVALIFGVTLYFGASLLAYIPTFLLGGLVFFLGLSFVVEWLYDTWFQLNKAEYLTILAVLIAITSFGMLAGVGVGTAFALIILMVNSRRKPVENRAISGANIHSGYADVGG